MRWMAWVGDQNLAWIGIHLNVAQSTVWWYQDIRPKPLTGPFPVSMSCWISEEWHTPVEPDEISALTTLDGDHGWYDIANRIRSHLLKEPAQT